MKPITRRTFLKTTASAAVAAAAIPVLPMGCLSPGQKDNQGYFESGFGITDNLCQRHLPGRYRRGEILLICFLSILSVIM